MGTANVCLGVLVACLGAAHAGPTVENGTFTKPANAVEVARPGETVLLVPKSPNGSWTLYWGTEGQWTSKATGTGAMPIQCHPSQFVAFATPGSDRWRCVSADVVPVAACAVDGGTCAVSAGTLYYGAGSNGYVKKELTGDASVACSPLALGVTDPAPGVIKSCFFLAAGSTGSSAGKVSRVPADVPACAVDGGRCVLPGAVAWQGFYGAGKTFVAIRGRGNVDCNPGSLGVEDPVPNVMKTCYVRPTSSTEVPSNFHPCAADGQTCAVPAGATWTGYYGEGTSLTFISGKGPFECLASKLGVADLLSGVTKICYVDVATSSQPIRPLVPVRCASDGGVCSFTGTKSVLYTEGLATWDKARRVNKLGVAGAIECSPRAFGTDPAPGTPKSCFVMEADPNIEIAEKCADDIGGKKQCDASKDNRRDIYYVGPDGLSAKECVQAPVFCSNEAFGGDPSPGKHKTCYSRPALCTQPDVAASPRPEVPEFVATPAANQAKVPTGKPWTPPTTGPFEAPLGSDPARFIVTLKQTTGYLKGERDVTLEFDKGTGKGTTSHFSSSPWDRGRFGATTTLNGQKIEVQAGCPPFVIGPNAKACGQSWTGTIAGSSLKGTWTGSIEGASGVEDYPSGTWSAVQVDPRIVRCEQEAKDAGMRAPGKNPWPAYNEAFAKCKLRLQLP